MECPGTFQPGTSAIKSLKQLTSPLWFSHSPIKPERTPPTDHRILICLIYKSSIGDKNVLEQLSVLNSEAEAMGAVKIKFQPRGELSGEEELTNVVRSQAFSDCCCFDSPELHVVGHTME